jgi:LysM repeat protein
MRSRFLILALAAVIAVTLVTAAPTGSASAWGNVHCVKYGETLYSIGARYGTSASAIAHANGLYNPNWVRAGQCLSIPSGYGYGYDHDYGKKPVNYGWGYGHGYTKPAYGWDYGHGYTGYGKWYGGYTGYGKGYDYGHGYDYGKGYGHKGGRVHCVRYGETLTGIAWQYGVSSWSIANANGLYNPNYLRAGMCLTIPSW